MTNWEKEFDHLFINTEEVRTVGDIKEFIARILKEQRQNNVNEFVDRMDCYYLLHAVRGDMIGVHPEQLKVILNLPSPNDKSSI